VIPDEVFDPSQVLAAGRRHESSQGRWVWNWLPALEPWAGEEVLDPIGADQDLQGRGSLQKSSQDGFGFGRLRRQDRELYDQDSVGPQVQVATSLHRRAALLELSLIGEGDRAQELMSRRPSPLLRQVREGLERDPRTAVAQLPPSLEQEAIAEDPSVKAVWEGGCPIQDLEGLNEVVSLQQDRRQAIRSMSSEDWWGVEVRRE
tara:strand:+ start:618 stop:1229 length:612 start_codon:yes stop_codon:yes gene_type:complete